MLSKKRHEVIDAGGLGLDRQAGHWQLQKSSGAFPIDKDGSAPKPVSRPGRFVAIFLIEIAEVVSS
jgi:hypothetical protein